MRYCGSRPLANLHVIFKLGLCLMGFVKGPKYRLLAGPIAPCATVVWHDGGGPAENWAYHFSPFKKLARKMIFIVSVLICFVWCAWNRPSFADAEISRKSQELDCLFHHADRLFGGG